MNKEIKKTIIISLVISNIIIFSCGKRDGIEIIRLNNALKENIYSSKSIKEYNSDAYVEEFDTVKFGKYEQDCNLDNGPEDVEWIILDKSNYENVVLCSKYVIDTRGFDEGKDNVNWENSYIRRWLNEDFYNKCFSEYDKQYIVKVNNSNNYSRDFFAQESVLMEVPSTVDNVSLLSIYEIEEYFGIDTNNNRTKATDYSKYYLYNDIYDEHVDYWTRTKAEIDDDSIVDVAFNGNIITGNGSYETNYLGIRPVIHINILKDVDDDKNKDYYNEIKKFDKEIFINSVKNVKTIKDYDEDTDIEKIDTVKIGYYVQKYNIACEGQDLEWIVMEKNEDKALLLSKYILFGVYKINSNFDYYANENKKYKLYDPECIAYYLNEIFYNRVFTDCKEIIIPVGYTDDNILDYDFNSSYKKEYVSLLSSKDCMKYFGNNIALNGVYKSSTSPTTFAKDNDRIALIDYEWEYNMYYADGAKSFVSKKDYEKEYEKYLGKSFWFLRDSLIFDLTEDLVKKDYIIDYVDYCGQFQKIMNFTSYGFRPAIWVSLK